MADKSKIEWCTSTWSPVRGCSRVSGGCTHCYAESLAARFSSPAHNGKKALWGHGYAEMTKAGPRWTRKVELLPDRLSIPLRWKKPRRIFVNSTSDTFHETLTNEEIAAIFGIMAACPQHTFVVLTKRAERLPEWFAWVADHYLLTQEVALVALEELLIEIDDPCHDAALRASVPSWPLPNVIISVSAEDQQRWDERIPYLVKTPAACRMVSVEPQLSLVTPRGLGVLVDAGPTWIIQGGESGAKARPFNIAWAELMRGCCEAVGAAYFLKQLGRRPFSIRNGFGDRDLEWPARATTRPLGDGYHWPKLKDSHGGNPEEWHRSLTHGEFRAFPELPA